MAVPVGALTLNAAVCGIATPAALLHLGVRELLVARIAFNFLGLLLAAFFPVALLALAVGPVCFQRRFPTHLAAVEFGLTIPALEGQPHNLSVGIGPTVNFGALGIPTLFAHPFLKAWLTGGIGIVFAIVRCGGGGTGGCSTDGVGGSGPSPLVRFGAAVRLHAPGEYDPVIVLQGLPRTGVLPKVVQRPRIEDVVNVWVSIGSGRSVFEETGRSCLGQDVGRGQGESEFGTADPRRRVSGSAGLHRKGDTVQQIVHTIQTHETTYGACAQGELTALHDTNLQQRVKDHPVLVFAIVAVPGNGTPLPAHGAQEQTAHIGPIKVAVRTDVHFVRLLFGPHHDTKVLIVFRCEQTPTPHSESDRHGFVMDVRAWFKLQHGRSFEINVKVLIPSVGSGRIETLVLVDEDALFGQFLDPSIVRDFVLQQQTAFGFPHPSRFQSRPLGPGRHVSCHDLCLVGSADCAVQARLYSYYDSAPDSGWKPSDNHQDDGVKRTMGAENARASLFLLSRLSFTELYDQMLLLQLLERLFPNQK